MTNGGASRATARLYDQHLRLLASHYSNMYEGRSNSAAFVANYFPELLGLCRPALFVEAGAYRAEASRRVRAEHPDCRVVAFEANPYNDERYVDELGFADAGIEYLNLAVHGRLRAARGPVVPRAAPELRHPAHGGQGRTRDRDPGTDAVGAPPSDALPGSRDPG